MAGRAVFWSINLPVLLDFLADDGLVFAMILRLVFQVGDFSKRTQCLFWIAVTFQTPAHALIFMMPDNGHFADVTVATDAAHTTADVDAVVEVSVIRSFVNFHPLHRLAGFHAFFDSGQVWRICLHMLVAVPASGTGWHVGVTALLDKAVGITASHSQLANVNFVRKRHGLVWLIAHAGIFLREIIRHPCGDSSSNREESNQELKWKRICPARKEISHSECRLIGACEKFHKREF